MVGRSLVMRARFSGAAAAAAQFSSSSSTSSGAAASSRRRALFFDVRLSMLYGRMSGGYCTVSAFGHWISRKSGHVGCQMKRA